MDVEATRAGLAGRPLATRLVAALFAVLACSALAEESQALTLTVTRSGAGSGIVTSDDGAIDCGATCGGSYETGTDVSLFATPAGNSQFTGWLGACTGVGICRVTVTGDKTVSATFASAPITGPLLDIDGTGGCDASTDGLLAIRHLFGLTGPALVAGAIGSNASRTTPTQIADYLADMRPGLDIDGNGQVDALTDGLLMIRYLSGLRDNGLVAGAVGPTARRAATEIPLFFQALCAAPHLLSVSRAGNGSGTVSSSGIACGSDCSELYFHNTTVTLFASPSIGSTFNGWTGSGCSGTSGCTVTMDAAKSVTATFVLDTHTLNVTRSGSGSGVVTSSPPGINCGRDCAQVYDHGSRLTLTGVQSADSTFTGWTGAGCSGTGGCNVLMDAAKTVNATFVLKVPLTVSKAGNGSGTVTSAPAGINCGLDCAQSYAVNTMVTLSLTPSAGSTFTGWSGGGCSGVGPCVVTMDAAKAVTATLVLNAYKLTVVPSGNGSGSVTSSPAGINCGSDCSQSYDYDTMVTLTPTQSTGSTFTSWNGGGCSGAGSCTVTMDTAKTVTATFTLDTHTLSVTRSGTGSGRVATPHPATDIDCGTDCSEVYNHGTAVSLIAVPSYRSMFTAWDACAGTGSCPVTMDASKTVNAVFTLLDTDPVCSSNEYLGAVSGDTESAMLTRSGTGEKWLRARITENNPGVALLSARIALVGPTQDYRLNVYCLSCGGTLVNNFPAERHVDVVRYENVGTTDDFDVLIEVQYYSGTSGVPWSLVVIGNTTPGAGPACP